MFKKTVLIDFNGEDLGKILDIMNSNSILSDRTQIRNCGWNDIPDRWFIKIKSSKKNINTFLDSLTGNVGYGLRII